MMDARARTPKLVSSVPDARAFRLSMTEGFLLSCIDGRTSENELALVTGKDVDAVRASLTRLENLGLITIEEVPVPPRTIPPRPAPNSVASAPVDNTQGGYRPATASAEILAPTPPRVLTDDVAAMAEDIDLEPKLRMELLSLHRTLDQLDHYALLGLKRDADKQATKRAYFELAAKFHPDRYFRKRLGTFKIRLEAVFSRLTLALETLSVPEKRAEYDAYLDEQRRIRGIESVLAEAAAESRRAQETVERVVRAEEQTPLAPPVAMRPPMGSQPEFAASPAPPPVGSELDPAARREVLARRLLGGRSSSASMPPGKRLSTAPPTTTADAMAALKRRYEDRVLAARGVEARRYAARGDEAVRTNQVAKAASAFEVALGLSPHDDELKRKAAAARAQAEAVLGETYRGQAEYEEKNGQWLEAARSWAGACKARPNDAVAHQRAANAMLKVGGDLAEALQLGQRASMLNPSSVASRVTLGDIYLATGRGAEARRELEAAAALAPQDDNVKQMLKQARKLT
jgi:curved DNA-binding protein CbpA